MDLHSYQKEKNIDTRDMVTEIKTMYPKYGKHIHSMVVNGAAYGVKLQPKAEKLLVVRWGAAEKKEKKRSKPLRAILSLNDHMARLLYKCVNHSGAPSTQMFLWELVLKYAAENNIQEEGNGICP